MDPNHPALLAARSSWRCVMNKDKEGWLGLMADDVRVEDPIGVSPTNPNGEGIQGKAVEPALDEVARWLVWLNIGFGPVELYPAANQDDDAHAD